MASPELDRRLAALARDAALSPEELDELADHIQCAVAHARARGLSEDDALGEAAHALGPLPILATEYRKNHPMRSLSRLAGIVCACSALALTILPLADLSVFFHLPSLVLVAGLVLGGLIASFGPVALLRCARQAFTREPLTGRDTTLSVRIARHGYRLSWAAGAVGVIVGVVLMLASADDLSQLGPGLAVTLLTVLYGALSAELVFSNLEQWLTQGAEAPPSPA